MTTLASTSHCSWHLDRRLPLAFVAGFLGVLLFHQPMLGVLHALGLTALAPYPMVATVPFGVPRVLSLAFWGGVWAIPLALLLRCVRARTTYWLTALLLGAIGPSLVNWLVVLPLKGAPVGGGWHPSGILTALIINGAWGLGTAFLLRWTSRRVVRTDQPIGP
ncbi:MAG: hypothetical protein LJE70_05885 [Chromatiaceae bacterium]|jgi:hypothetical protein|nr:hypothetical protein [Chromatiaceae bacterium]